MRYLPKLLPFLRPYMLFVAASILITLMAAGISLLAPWPMQILVDNVLSGQPMAPLLANALGQVAQNRYMLLAVAVATGLGVAVAGGILDVLHNYVSTKAHQGIALDFRCDLFTHAQSLHLAFHDTVHSARTIYAINYHADAAARLLLATLPLAQSLLILGGMFGITLRMDPELTLVSLMVVPLLYSSLGYYVNQIQPKLRNVKVLEGQSISIVHQAIMMLRVIVAFGRESHEVNRFRTQGTRVVNARVDVTVRQTLYSLVVTTITAVGTALVLGLGAYHVLEGRLTIGRLLVVLAYIAAVYQPLETISGTISSLQESLAGLWFAFSLRDIKPEITDAPNAITLERAKGRVTFDNVDFRYTQRASTLTEISLEAQPGHVVAIVGPTGAGKSTLVSLIPRFYEVGHGRVLVDGTDIRDLTIRSLREQIALVLQEPVLFQGTIAENIRYGRLEASEAEIVEAARAANAHDFIQALPGKYNTQVGERGVQLSGGERQRISVARAFLKNAPILILDEPTSSIDSKTESVILDALDQLMVGRTTFLIAHRLSTLRRADHIVVLDRGRLVEQGTQAELLKRAGLFKQIWDLQMSNGRPASPLAGPTPTASLGKQPA